MPRRGNIAKSDVLPDPIYNSKMVTRLVNSVMLDGKKGVAQKIVYDAFRHDQGEDRQGSSGSFEQAMENIMPSLESRPAVSAVPTIRFLWRFVPPAVRPWVCAG